MSDDLVRAASEDAGRVALEDTGHRLLYPLSEARTKLGGIGHTTIYELFKAGELTRVNIGRRAFVTAESLAAYVDRLSEASA